MPPAGVGTFFNGDVDCWLLIALYSRLGVKTGAIVDCWLFRHQKTLLIVDCWLLIVDCLKIGFLHPAGCWLLIVDFDCWAQLRSADCWLSILIVTISEYKCLLILIVTIKTIAEAKLLDGVGKLMACVLFGKCEDGCIIRGCHASHWSRCKLKWYNTCRQLYNTCRYICPSVSLSLHHKYNGPASSVYYLQ